MIEFSESRYFAAVWFAYGEIPCAGHGDFLAAVFRNQGETDWKIEYRIRYDNHPDHGEDHRSWYGGGGFQGTVDDVIAKTDPMMTLIAKVLDGTVEMIEVRGNGPKAIDLMSKRPWFRVKSIEALP